MALFKREELKNELFSGLLGVYRIFGKSNKMRIREERRQMYIRVYLTRWFMNLVDSN